MSPPVLTPTRATVDPSANFAVIETDITTTALVESSLNAATVTNPSNTFEIFC